jgi:hypothetical protein
MVMSAYPVDVVLQNPKQAFENVLVDGFQITPRNRHSQDLFVERPGKVTVDQLVVEDRLGNNATAKRKELQVVVSLDQVGLIVGLVGVRPEVALLEQSVVGIHHLLQMRE